MSSKTLTLDSSAIYLSSHSSLSTETPQAPPPLSFSLLSSNSSLPSIPPDFPSSKLIPKTRFIVDGFRFSGDYSVSYCLSHFHSDHYTGLSPNWSSGIIFCSDTTSRLLVEVLKVSPFFIFPLSMLETYLIDGCEVTLIEANHCPGAVQFLFKVPVSERRFERYVYTGDFRYCDSMKLEPALSEFIGADAVFLDTTYCNPKFKFPTQQESIDYVVSVIEREGTENEKHSKSVLFLVATYVIGKERILFEIFRRCNTKIFVDSRKMAVLRALGFGDVGAFTEEEAESAVHVVGWNVLGETWPYFRPNFVKLKEIMNDRGYSKVVGFVPTGWTYEVKHKKFAVRTKESFEIHLVPYSEHSNYDELREYVKFLKPKCVIPTVGTDVENLDGKHANAIKKHFTGLVDEMANKQVFLKGFHLRAQESYEKLVKQGSNVSVKVESEEPQSECGARTDTCCENNITCSTADKELDSVNVLTTNVEETNKVLQELCDCLPAWVTRDQLTSLLSNSGGDVAKAVSDFYEHETEFYDQVIASKSSDCTSQARLHSEIEFTSEPLCAQNSPIMESPLSQIHESPSIMHLGKSTSVSPSKRRKNHENKPKKKGRITPGLDHTGPKQYTITKFFSKASPLVSEDCKGETSFERCSYGKDSLEDCGTSSHKEAVNQFMQIVNGTESLRSYAAVILKQTNCDVNKALDMYYRSCEVVKSEDKDRLAYDNSLVEAQCHIEMSSFDQETEVAKNGNNGMSIPNQSVDFIAVNCVAALPVNSKNEMLPPEPPVTSCPMDLVSLPPEKYFPLEHACWNEGQPAPYIHLARTFSLLEDERGKIRATSMLCNMFRSLLALSPEDVLPAMYLCTNKIAPDYENMDLNIGGSIVTSALEEACGTHRSKIRDLYNNLGDLGDVAQLCRRTQSLLAPPAPLSIRGVFSVLRKISVQTGSGSTVRKRSLIVNLMRSCREKEMKFLVRTLVRNLRIGAMMRTILPALTQAVVINSDSREGRIESSKEILQDLLIPSLMDKGIRFSLATLSMVPGVPIKPMLAKITNEVSQVLKVFENKAFTCEYKYDGQRAQIHKLADGSIRVFSRNGEETTSRFPDLVHIVKESCSRDAPTFVMDAEVVAVDRKNGIKLMSFQELSSRERGSKCSSIAVENIKVDICIFAFDVMFSDGKQLLGFPLRHRRKYLKDLFGDEKVGYFEYAKEITVEADEACETNGDTVAKMKQFLNDALHSSCEGIMAKSLDDEAGYTPSKRSDTWLKVKRDYVEELNDSLDLVPIGAWYGNGRKAGWYSPFLMACYNPDTEEYECVCRVMSGFSDSFYVEMKEYFSGDRILSKRPPYYRTTEVPNIWFAPQLVWEIRGAELTVSRVHQAAIGLVHPSRGVSIRFPRFIGSRPDRKPDECSMAPDIAEMFHSQPRKMDVNVGE